jgi:putative hydrolase of the HAD superfamily
MIRWVLFDAAGTLIHVHGSVAKIYAEVARQHHIDIDESFIRQRFPTALEKWMHGGTDRPTHEADQKERWQNIVRDCLGNIDIQRFEPIFRSLWEHFRSPKAWKIAPQFETVVGELVERKYRLGIASNFDDRLLNILKGFPVSSRFERIFISSKVGWSKPSPHFFQHIEAELATQPSELMMVGDSVQNDFLAPQQRGWKAVLFDGEEQHRDLQPRITDFSELLHWL